MAKLLLLEDDIGLIDGLKYTLQKNGFEVDILRTVQEALHYLSGRSASGEDGQDTPYDLLILDVTLPDGTGFEVCEQVRRQGSQVPILFLTASDEEVNVIRGLDCGGDDYVTKPFRIGELCSRIHALLRRSSVPLRQTQSSDMPVSSAPQDYHEIFSGDLFIDLLDCRVIRNGRKLDLTGAEYRLLCLLVRNANRTVTRDNILNELWDNTGDFVDDNTLSVYMRRLREKIEADPSHPQHLITVRGFGYQWSEQGAENR